MFTDTDWWRTSVSPPWTATMIFQFIYIVVHLLIVPWELRTQFLCISFTNRSVWPNSLALLSLISCCADILGCQTAISSLMESTLPSPILSMTGTVVKDHCLPGHVHVNHTPALPFFNFTWVFWFTYFVIWQWQSSLHLPAIILLLNCMRRRC